MCVCWMNKCLYLSVYITFYPFPFSFLSSSLSWRYMLSNALVTTAQPFLWRTTSCRCRRSWTPSGHPLSVLSPSVLPTFSSCLWVPPDPWAPASTPAICGLFLRADPTFLCLNFLFHFWAILHFSWPFASMCTHYLCFSFIAQFIRFSRLLESLS